MAVSDRHSGCIAWWQRHNKSFSLWFLGLDREAQRSVLLKCCPDMPELTPASRELYTGIALTASDMLIPELTQEALLSNNGKLLLLLITRRLISPDHCLCADAKFLNSKYAAGVLPVFPEVEERFKGIDTPFIDPMDRREAVNCLDPTTTTPGVRENVNTMLEEGKIVRGQVWIAMKVSRYVKCERILFRIFTDSKNCIGEFYPWTAHRMRSKTYICV